MIELVGVGHEYTHGHPVLSDISWRIERGQMLAITGASGSGKSTLLFIAGLLIRASSGHVLVNGHRADRMSDRQRSAMRGGTISFVFQDAMLDPSRSVLDNVLEPAEYGRTSRAHDRHRALDLLADLGVDVDPRRRPGEISGGQGQRVALCRALLPGPSSLLADEPTGNLDADSTSVVLGRLRDEAERGTAVAIATHDPHVVAACDDVLAV